MHLSDQQFKNVSRNTAILKFFCILLVVIGHFFSAFSWIIMWFAMFIFSFLSGFFTHYKYSDNLILKQYWLKKFYRLGIDLLIIHGFLLLFFIITDKNDIFTWHTLLSFFGLNGLLSWSYIPLKTPFGSEIWFLTTLLIFYFIYPVLRLCFSNKIFSAGFTILLIFLCFFLHKRIPYPHALWLSICGYITALTCIEYKIWISKNKSLIFGTTIILLAFCLNCFSVKQFNFFVILFLSLAFIFFTFNFHIPKFIVLISSVFQNCLLEIYLTHRHLYIRPSGNPYLDFFLSLCLILCVAKILKILSSTIKARLAYSA